MATPVTWPPFYRTLRIQSLSEYRDVLVRPPLIEKFGLSQHEIDDFFATLDIDGELVDTINFPAIDVRYPDDSIILAAAICGNADYLVTGDNDLLTLAGDSRLGNLKIVTARAFLELL